MQKNFWKDKKVLVTGGAGFIGSHLVEKLVNNQAKVTILDNLSNGKEKNLRSVIDKIKILKGDVSDLKTARGACRNQDAVMNLAAKVAGIEYNRTHQATMLSKNLPIAMNMIEAARLQKVQRFLVVSSACVYPRSCSIPTPETEGFLDQPEPTNGGYGWAKRMAEILGKYYSQEFGMKVAIVRPYNCYGPRDHFDPQTSHVIPALIKRVFDGENPLRVWGSGKQTRAFLYVKDLVKGMMLAVEKSTSPSPINLGTNEEVAIAKLVKIIVNISGIKTRIVFDTTKPDGSPRRNSNNSKSLKLLGFKPGFSLEQGLEKTIKWYRNEFTS